MTPEGQIPQSDALSEAGSGAESIAELLSRDPEILTEADFQREIDALRVQAERWQEAERLGLNKKRGAKKAPQEPPAKAFETSEDLGL